jgi:hypothetical protein
MVQASVAGSIDFKAFDGSTLAWRRLRLQTSALDHALHLKVLELSSIRAAALQGVADTTLTLDEKQDYATDSILRYEAKARPWFGPYKGQNGSTGDSSPEDLMASWFAVFKDNEKVLLALRDGTPFPLGEKKK